MRLFTWKHRILVQLITWSSIVLFGLIGYGLDIWLNTKPIFLVIMLLISFPVNAWRLKNGIKMEK